MNSLHPQREMIEIFHNNGQYLSSALNLRYAGKEHCSPLWHFGPAKRSQYLLHFILHGKGRFCVNAHSYELSANHVFLIRPGESTYYVADKNQPWEYVWFAFDGIDAESIIKNCGFSSDTPYLNFSNGETLTFYLNELIRELEQPTHNDYTLLGYMYLIFSFLSKNCNKELAITENTYLNPSIKYIHDNYSSSITIQDIANYAKVDRTYLYRLFIKEFSISPKRYLTQYRIKAATDLLITTNLPISEIAAACGFVDSSSFGKYFLEYTGFTPTQYRQIDGKKQLSWKPTLEF